MLPRCFEVPHPILIRPTIQSYPTKELRFRVLLHACLLSAVSCLTVGGQGSAKRVLHSSCSLKSETTFPMVCFYNAKKNIGERDEPLPCLFKITNSRWWELSGNVPSSGSKAHIQINENQLELSWVKTREDISASRRFLFLSFYLKC